MTGSDGAGAAPEGSPWHEAAWVGLAALALASWWLWPLPRHAADHGMYDSPENPFVRADFDGILWILGWGAHALGTAPWRLFQANAFHPFPDALAFSEHLLGYAPLFAPVYAVTGNPVLAANALILATYPLGAVAMYLLARRWLGRPASVVAAFFYAFAVYRLTSVLHMQMLGVQYLPLAVLLTDRWLESGRVREAVLLAAALALHLLSSFYLAYMLVLVYAPALLVLLWWRRPHWPRVAGLGVALALPAALFLATAVPYLRFQRLGIIPRFDPAVDEMPIGLVPYFGHATVWAYLEREGVGPGGYLLAAVGLLVPRRALRLPRLVGLAIAVVGLVCSFGMELPYRGGFVWSPYQLLAAWVPGFSTVRLPNRFVQVLHLGLALLAGIGVERLVGGRRPAVAWPLVASFLTVVLATYHYPRIPLHERPVGDAVPAAYRWLREHGEGRPLMELPTTGPAQAAFRMHMSVHHWLPIVAGYSGYPPESPRLLHAMAMGLPGEPALQTLIDHVDLGWLLVHRDEMQEKGRRAWQRPLPPGLERAGEWGGDLLLRVRQPVRHDHRARLVSETETLGGIPLVPLAACPGSVRLESPALEGWAWGVTRVIELRLTNRGTQGWPGWGAIPRHLVRMRICFRAGPDEPCRGPLQDLGADVPPGASVVVSAFARPRRFGDDTLYVALEQVGDGPLEACGVAPLFERIYTPYVIPDPTAAPSPDADS